MERGRMMMTMGGMTIGIEESRCCMGGAFGIYGAYTG